MQQQKVFAIVFLGSATILLAGSPQSLRAQSAPPGQVSHRMSNTPASAKDTLQRVISSGELTNPSNLQELSVPGINAVGAPASENGSTQPSDPCSDKAANSPEMDQCQATNALGTVKMVAWEAVVAIDNEVPIASAAKLTAARKLAALFQDTTDLPTAESLISRQEIEVKGANSNVIAAVEKVKGAIKRVRCSTTVEKPNKGSSPTGKTQYSYGYRVRFPTFGRTCSGDAIKNYFNAGDPLVEAANQVKYLYNAQQSASQFSSDLLTSTFPGFQAILAGTATAGSSQPAPATTTATGSAMGGIIASRVFAHPSDTAITSNTPTTDSVATAVSKIENGGDFNVRFPVPLLYYTHGSYSISSGTHPNVGFNIDKFSGQTTITESTEYGFNVPWETYMQTKSLDVVDGVSSAILFLDLQPSAEVISTGLANKIGLTGSRAFFLGQAAAGIQFSNSIGVSFQYFYGPKQALASTDASGTTTMTNPRIQGFHLAISFSPQKKSKS